MGKEKRPLHDLTGQTFGALRAIGRVPAPEEERAKPGFSRRAYWLCECDCGNECIKSSVALTHVKWAHCGCMSEEQKRAAVEAACKAPRRRYALTSEEVELRVASLTRPHTCPRCGSIFETFVDDWGYQLDGKWYCSWHCVRAQEREEQSKRKEYGYEG